jgi:hypothetical protein
MFAKTTELTGPISARLWVSTSDLDDLDFVIGIEKWSNGKRIPLKALIALVATVSSLGWQEASLRALDDIQSTDYLPVPACTKVEFLENAKPSKCRLQWATRQPHSKLVNPLCLSLPVAGWQAAFH